VEDAVVELAVYRSSRYAVCVPDPLYLDCYLWISLNCKSPTLVRLRGETHRALLEGQTHRLSPHCVARLLDAAILVPSGSDERNDVISDSVRAAANRQRLVRIVMPTASCPLGCGDLRFGAYCGQIHSPSPRGLAGSELLRDLKLHLSSGRYKYLTLCLFGGEPLIASDEIADVLKDARTVCDKFSVEFDDVYMITSGLLLSTDVAARLHAAGLRRFDVTLDGLPATHDRRRCTKGGEGTFHRIYSNLLTLASDERLEHLDLTVRMNVDTRNADDVLPLFEMLRSSGLWPRYQFGVAAVYNWGSREGGTAFHDRRLFAHVQMELFRAQYRAGGRPRILPERVDVLCAVTDPHAAVIDPFGKRWKCTETPLTGRSDEDRIAEQNWGKQWVQVLHDGTTPCRECRMLPVCGGACPKQWFEGIEPCPSTKDNLAERMILAAAYDPGLEAM
jgi:uncharacterized protein